MSDHQHVYTATVMDRDSVRAAEWLVVHRSLTVPIVSPVAELTVMNGLGVVPIYKLDVTALGADERERLIQHVAAKFGLADAHVASDIAGEHGVPLLAEGLRVACRCLAPTVGGRP